MTHPFTTEIAFDTETPVSFYMKVASNEPYSFLLESAEKDRTMGRFSFIGFDPIKVITFDESKAPINNPLSTIKLEIDKFKKQFKNLNNIKNLQRFFGGAVGYFGYDMVRFFEKVPSPAKNPSLKIPEGLFIIPRVVIAFDHYTQRGTIIIYDDKKNAEKTLKEINRRLKMPLKTNAALKHIPSPPKSNNSPHKKYQNLVKQAKERIAAGELIQIVLSQEKTVKTNKSAFELYREMRLQNPSPYMYFLKYPTFSIVGASPETMVRVENSKIHLRPIAGTRRRGKTPEEETKLEKELQNDPKERAEHMMLLDLGRNDVGRFAEIGTVELINPMHVERFSHVMHLVSEVTGKLRRGKTIFDVFRACFPAGTLTGAPKVRAMQLISRFEDKKRGLYGGAVGYFDFCGNMDFAIAIRTLIYKQKKVSVQAGAGIVHDSIPAREDAECAHKMASCLSVTR